MARLKAALAVGEFEGLRFTVLDRPVQVGDTYLAARNTGPHVLTARKVVPYPTPENGLTHGGWVVAQEPAYSFDLGECVPVTFDDVETVDAAAVDAP
jgi:hypothetical protein